MDTITSFLVGLLDLVLQFAKIIINIFLYVLSFVISILQQVLASLS